MAGRTPQSQAVDHRREKRGTEGDVCIKNSEAFECTETKEKVIEISSQCGQRHWLRLSSLFPFRAGVVAGNGARERCLMITDKVRQQFCRFRFAGVAGYLMHSVGRLVEALASLIRGFWLTFDLASDCAFNHVPDHGACAAERLLQERS